MLLLGAVHQLSVSLFTGLDICFYLFYDLFIFRSLTILYRLNKFFLLLSHLVGVPVVDDAKEPKNCQNESYHVDDDDSTANEQKPLAPFLSFVAVEQVLGV